MGPKWVECVFINPHQTQEFVCESGCSYAVISTLVLSNESLVREISISSNNININNINILDRSKDNEVSRILVTK